MNEMNDMSCTFFRVLIIQSSELLQKRVSAERHVYKITKQNFSINQELKSLTKHYLILIVRELGTGLPKAWSESLSRSLHAFKYDRGWIGKNPLKPKKILVTFQFSW